MYVDNESKISRAVLCGTYSQHGKGLFFLDFESYRAKTLDVK